MNFNHVRPGHDDDDLVPPVPSLMDFGRSDTSAFPNPEPEPEPMATPRNALHNHMPQAGSFVYTPTLQNNQLRMRARGAVVTPAPSAYVGSPSAAAAPTPNRPTALSTTVCLCVYQTRGEIAFAYYHFEKDIICTTRVVLESREKNEVKTIINRVKTQVQPDQIVASSDSPKAMLATLESPCTRIAEVMAMNREGEMEDVGGGDDADAEISAAERDKAPIFVSLVRKTFFGYERARRKISQLAEKGPSGAGETDRHAGTGLFRDKDVHRLLNTNEPILVSVVGGLLEYMASENLLPGQNGSVVPEGVGIQLFSLDHYLYVEHMTLRALQVFNVRTGVLGARRKKSGQSLVGLLCSYASSQSGRQCIKNWLLKPIVNAAELNARYDAVAILLQPSNCDNVRVMQAELRKVKNIQATLKRVVNYRCGKPVRDWHCIWQFCKSTLDIANLARELLRAAGIDPSTPAPPSVPGPSSAVDARRNLFRRLAQQHAAVKTIGDVKRWIEGIVDFPKSYEEGRLVPNLRLDKNLDEWRRVYDSLDVFLDRIQNEVAQGIDFELEGRDGVEMEVSYIPQIGYVISFLGVHDKHFDADGIFPPARQMEFQFKDMSSPTGEIALFYKNHRMRELDQYFGDVRSTVTDMENSLTRQLRDKVVEQCGVLFRMGALLAAIDGIAAMATMSQENACVRPQIVKDTRLKIVEGRHILQCARNVTATQFVPNDTNLKPSSSRTVQIVTGPNSSGKSVYLKQVGLIVILAHIGCFVPAKRMVFGTVDRVFSRIATVESSAVNESAFTIDLGQMATMLASCTERSLLLVDEFGKGTSCLDGPPLLAATLHYLDKRNAKCILTTHFWEIFQYGLLEGTTSIRTYRMKLKLGAHADDDEHAAELTDPQFTAETFVPLFKLTACDDLNSAQDSYGLVCAKLGGIPPHVVARAAKVRGAIQARTPVPSFREELAADSGGARDEKMEAVVDLFLSTPDWATASDDDVDRMYTALFPDPSTEITSGETANETSDSSVAEDPGVAANGQKDAEVVIV